jgi:hypothetical protein
MPSTDQAPGTRSFQMPYTAFDMIRSMEHEFDLSANRNDRERGSLYRFISSLNGFFRR